MPDAASRLARLKRAFLEVVESPPEARAEILAQLAREDPPLAEEVTSLLEAERGGDGARLDPLVPAADRDPPPHPGRIGPYMIERLLGEGGMARVYLAQQESPVRRAVALKVVKPGHAGEEVLRRFESERRALAGLQHPNIARILDVGADPDGPPYFAMDLVHGLPITEACAERGLGLAERLGLFSQVCRGVQHAHGRGILHRDLKPSNILVTIEDGRLVPKIIDFGVATALSDDSPLADRRHTLATQIVGTLDYMSPEQAEFGNPDLDARADVYALGVILYELLTGDTPLRLHSSGETFAEAQRKIRSLRARRPSEAPRSLAGIAAPAELDCVVLKALEKSPDDRYQTAKDLADEIDRFLSGQPLTARPPTRSYLIRKFATRHRWAVAGASAFLLVLVLGLAGTTAGLMLTARQRDIAQQAVADLTGERENTRRALAETEAIASFLRDLLMRVHPSELGPSASFGDILRAGAEELRTTPPDSPRVQARLAVAVGEPMYLLGDFTATGDLLEPIVPHLQREDSPEADELLGRVLMRLGYVASRRGDRAASVRWFEQAAAHAESARLQVLDFQSRAALAQSLAAMGDYDRAIGIMQALLEHPAALADDLQRASLLSNLGGTLGRAGRSAEGAAYSLDGYRIRLARLPNDPTTYQMGRQLGLSLMEVGRLPDALEILTLSEDAASRSLPEHHPDVLNLRVALGYALARSGEGERGVALIRSAIESYQSFTEVPAPQIDFERGYLVGAILASGDRDGAVDEARRILSAADSDRGAIDPTVVQLRLQIGSMFSVLGAPADALPILTQAFEDSGRAGLPDSLRLRIAAAIRWSYRRLDRPEDEARWARIVENGSLPAAAP